MPSPQGMPNQMPGLPQVNPAAEYGADMQQFSDLETQAAGVEEQAAQSTAQTAQQLQGMQTPQRQTGIFSQAPYLIALAAIGGSAMGIHARVMLGATNGMVKGMLMGNQQAYDDAVKQYSENRQKLLDLWDLQQRYYDQLYHAYGDRADAKLKAAQAAEKLSNDQFNQSVKMQQLNEKQKMDDYQRWLGKARYLEEIRRDDSVIKQRTAGSGADLPAGFDQSKIDYYARQQLAGDTTWRTGLSRTKEGIAIIKAVDARVPELAKESGLTPEAVSTRKEVRHSLARSLDDRQKYVATSTQFIENFNKQADLVEKYLQPGAGGADPVINRWIQAGRKQVAGDADVTALDTAIRGLAREHQRIVTGVTSNAQLHAAAQQTADDLLNRDMTPTQIRATLGVMREEAQNARDSGQDEVKSLRQQLSTIGDDSDTQPASAPTVTPDQAIEELKRRGKWPPSQT